MARSEKSENKNRVLGLDIGNGYGYVSLLENPKNDPIPLLPASLSTQGIRNFYLYCRNSMDLNLRMRSRERKSCVKPSRQKLL